MSVYLYVWWWIISTTNNHYVRFGCVLKPQLMVFSNDCCFICTPVFLSCKTFLKMYPEYLWNNNGDNKHSVPSFPTLTKGVYFKNQFFKNWILLLSSHLSCRLLKYTLFSTLSKVFSPSRKRILTSFCWIPHFCNRTGNYFQLLLWFVKFVYQVLLQDIPCWWKI